MSEPAILKPAIVFCHGAWHSVQFFEKAIAILEPLGYKCITVPLPSVGSLPPVNNLDDDIAAVRTAVIKELDAGRNVMVNAHSMLSLEL
jgi:pimeloyl-ACP methyl ester carboxylesterase